MKELSAERGGREVLPLSQDVLAFLKREFPERLQVGGGRFHGSKGTGVKRHLKYMRTFEEHGNEILELRVADEGKVQKYYLTPTPLFLEEHEGVFENAFAMIEGAIESYGKVERVDVRSENYEITEVEPGQAADDIRIARRLLEQFREHEPLDEIRTLRILLQAVSTGERTEAQRLLREVVRQITTLHHDKEKSSQLEQEALELYESESKKVGSLELELARRQVNEAEQPSAHEGANLRAELEELTRQNAEKERRLQELYRERSQLVKERTQVEAQLARAEEAVSKKNRSEEGSYLRRQIEGLKEENESLAERNGGLQTRNQQLEQELAEQRAELKASNDSLEDLRKTIEALEGDVQANEPGASHAALLDELRTARSELARTRSEHEALNFRFDVQAGETKAHLESVQALQYRIAHLERQLQEVQEEKKRLAELGSEEREQARRARAQIRLEAGRREAGLKQELDQMKTAVSLLLARVKTLDPETHALVAAELSLSTGDSSEMEAAKLLQKPASPGKLLRTLAVKLRSSIEKRAAQRSQTDRARFEAQKSELVSQQEAAQRELEDIGNQRQKVLQDIATLAAAGKLEEIVGSQDKIQPLLKRGQELRQRVDTDLPEAIRLIDAELEKQAQSEAQRAEQIAQANVRLSLLEQTADLFETDQEFDEKAWIERALSEDR